MALTGYGEKLRCLRLERGETLEDTAKAVGLQASAISNYENETRMPRDEHKVTLANHFGLSVQEIFFAPK